MSQVRIGVYFSTGRSGASSVLDFKALAAYAAALPQVVEVKNLGAGPSLDPVVLARELVAKKLTTIVIGAPSPGYLKTAFTRALALAGQDPEAIRLASFRERGAGFGDPTERAKGVLACAVLNVPYGMAAVPDSTPMHPATLVVGGGIAGIQTALEIADAGKKVYLVERTPTIGGHMAMFDKTFPTLDCAACILTPKMVAVDQHENIELMTWSEVESVSGLPGAFHVKIRKKARYVDLDACVACNDCSAICPVSTDSEFDSGISQRKAIYIPFPQAIPNAFVVDKEHCTWLQSGGTKCGACLKKCSKDAIHFDAQDELVDLEVGNIVLATGFDVFDARRIERYGYGTYPNVITALEFERLTNASGPTGGNIVMKSKKLNKRTKQEEWVFEPDGPRPKSVAIVHCVGSRDRNYNPYCSRVCCMYSLKFAHLVKEKLPDAHCYEFYIDMRAYGKGYEEFFERIKDEGIHVVRGRSAKVREDKGQLILRGEDIVEDKVVEMQVDMVLLAVGLEPDHSSCELSKLTGVPLDEGGWFQESDYNTDPTGTARGGIFLAGTCQGPKDIPDTVAQASSVAAAVLKTLQRDQGSASHGDLTLASIETLARQLAEVRS
jgi:heterodisulfide reductase subunit A